MYIVYYTCILYIIHAYCILYMCIRDANLSSKFLSGQLDNFLALSGQYPDNWAIFEFFVNRLSTK